MHRRWSAGRFKARRGCGGVIKGAFGRHPAVNMRMQKEWARTVRALLNEFDDWRRMMWETADQLVEVEVMEMVRSTEAAAEAATMAGMMETVAAVVAARAAAASRRRGRCGGAARWRVEAKTAAVADGGCDEADGGGDGSGGGGGCGDGGCSSSGGGGGGHGGVGSGGVEGGGDGGGGDSCAAAAAA